MNGTVGTGGNWVQQWDDGWNGQDPRQGQPHNVYENQPPNQMNYGPPMNYGGHGFPQQPMGPHQPPQGYPQQ